MTRLLRLQASLMSRGNWYLGLSAEGLLQLTSLQPFGRARDLMTALDLAQIIARTALHTLLGGAGARL